MDIADFDKPLSFWINKFSLAHWANPSTWHAMPTRLFELSADDFYVLHESTAEDAIILLVDAAMLADLLDCRYLDIAIYIEKPYQSGDSLTVDMKLHLHSVYNELSDYTSVWRSVYVDKKIEDIAIEIVNKIKQYMTDKLLLGDGLKCLILSG